MERRTIFTALAGIATLAGGTVGGYLLACPTVEGTPEYDALLAQLERAEGLEEAATSAAQAYSVEELRDDEIATRRATLDEKLAALEIDTLTDGFWIFGTDIPTGTYQLVKAPRDVYARCSIKKLASDGTMLTFDIVAEGVQATATFANGERVVLDGCGPWERVS